MEKHFATLKLLDSDTDCKLTEAYSYAELPYSRGLHVKHMYRSKSQSNLVRQYSCENFFSDDTDARELELSNFAFTDKNRCIKECRIVQSYSDLCKSSTSHFYRSNNILQAPKFIPNKVSNEVQCDKVKNMGNTIESTFPFCASSANTNGIDTSNPSTITKPKKCEKVDNKVEEINAKRSTNKGTYKDIKKKFRPMVVKTKSCTKRKVNGCLCTCLTVCIIPVLTVIFAMLMNLDTHMVCNRMTLFSNASIELEEKIYGQKNAISSIISFLDHDFIKLKVLCLIGGTGVGKSYSVEIIAKNFPSPNKIFLYDAALGHPIDTKALSSLDSHHLFVVENLKTKHLDIFANIIDAISETHKCLTVIAIFNIEEVNNRLERRVDLEQGRSTIHEAMKNKIVDFSIVPYEPLDEGTLELCITQAASASGLRPTRDQITEVKQSLLSSGTGCKGAYAKLQVIGRS